MSDILARILATKAEEVAAAKRARPYAEVAAAAREQSPPRDFAGALRNFRRQNFFCTLLPNENHFVAQLHARHRTNIRHH